METPLNTNAQGRWATALAADETTAQAARSELAGIFWYPIYVFLRAGTGDGETAASRTETVLTRFIDEPASDAPLLREWLLALAQSELAAPNPREPLLTLDREWSEQRFAAEGTAAPAEMFVRRWTLDLLEQAIATLRAEYDAAGQGEVFAAVQPFLDFSAGASGSDSYAQLAAALGVSDGAARKMVFDLRTRYREVLRAALADTVATPEQIASELQTLMIQLPPPDENLAPSPGLQQLNPEQLLARGMNSVQMSTAGGLGWTPPTIAEAARLFPGYEVVKMLGHGGMGAVYQARQESLDRLVALKLLPLEISVDQSFADRFRREARAMAKLNHPNIISVHDFGQTAEGHLFFAMEFVEGASLNDHVHHREGGLPPVEALGIIEQVCEALAYAHEQGIVHRDIKPANVMIDPRGRVKIADFGLARISDPTAEQWGQTMTGVIMGTPDYMSPEQKRGMRVDARSDIYSVGVMFYEMLCKETPQGAFELPSQRCGLPKELDAIITRAIAPQPEKRFQTTTELKQAVGTVKPTVARSVARKAQAAKLKAGAVTSPAKAHAVPVATPAAKKPLGLYLGIGAGVLALIGVGIFLMKGKPAAKTASAPALSTPAPTAASSAKPPEAKPAPAPAVVAAGNEKWVDGLAQFFGDTKTKEGFERENNGGARASKGFKFLSPIPSSAPAFRDQVARVRARFPANEEGGDLRLRVRTTANERKGYFLRPHLASNHVILAYEDPVMAQTNLHLVKFPLPADFDAAAFHTLELRIVGDLLTASLDGKKLGEKRDTKFAEGHPSLMLNDAVIESFEYANLDPAAPAPAPVAAKPATTPSAPSSAKSGDVLTFGGHRYQLVEEAVTWNEAKAKAEAMGGHLATITTKEEHEQLQATLLSRRSQTEPKPGADFWLGAQRKSVGAAWEWITGEPFGFTVWMKGKPDNNDRSDYVMRCEPTRGDAKLEWDDCLKTLAVGGFLVEWDSDAPAKPAPIAAAAPAAAEPMAPAAKVPTEMEKWLAQVDGPQQESYQREVMKPFEAGLAELQKGYLGALDSRIAAASTAGQLDVALGWRNELQRFREAGQAVPADDADLATVAAPLVAKALPPLRTQFRTHKAKLDADRLARAKAAFAKYDAMLSPAITQLTQRQRLDDALLLQNKREEVQKAWLPAAPAPAAPAPGAPSTPVPKPLGSGTVAPPAPAPTSKAGTAAAIRAAAEWVIAHGGQVEVPGKKITKPEEIPAGALAVQAVTFKLKDAVPTDAELHALTALGAATNVKVENWDAPDSTLIFLQAFGNVGLLQFVGCPQLTDAMLEGLPPMPNVGSIAIKDCPGITGTGLAKLKAPKLNEVSFTRGAPTDAGLAAISQHDGIKAVQAGGPAITDAGVAHLERLRALTKLILSNTSVTPSALTFLAKRKEFIHLDYLNAAAPDFVANAQAIAKIVPNLPTLGVTGKASGPEATRALLGFKSLRSLQWLGSEMNDATFGELAALTDLEGLTCAKANLTDAAVDTVLALKKLADLNLSDNPELTDAGLLKLKPLKKLKAVHFSRSKATEAGAAELKKAIPGVEVFR